MPGETVKDCFGTCIACSERVTFPQPHTVGMLAKVGLSLTGLFPNEQLAEIVEFPDHPLVHRGAVPTEFKSRPNKAHPLFRNFIGATARRRSGTAEQYRNR